MNAKAASKASRAAAAGRLVLLISKYFLSGNATGKGNLLIDSLKLTQLVSFDLAVVSFTWLWVSRHNDEQLEPKSKPM
ncbi:hypothetical protein D3C76_1367300 [compost metagenome]